ncbi:hypothetical protein Dip510_001213 [Elusimicrobium posterum]|uniref:sulfite exporter TauE/SafE family protein n=1 Tax=Elusimicrobium posterum TaxID=3116653 RepID=UPI003C72FDF5
MSIYMLLPLGFAIGFAGGMFGIGGGLFVVPLLHFGFGVPLHSAIACSLLTIVASSMVSTMAKVRHGMTNIRLSKVMEIPSILGAIFGSVIVGAMPIEVIKIFFCVVALIMTFNMLKNPFKKITGRKMPTYCYADKDNMFADCFRDKATGRTVRYEAKNVKWVVPLSVFSGFLSSTIGIGGGVVNVPLLTNVGKLPVKVASATSSYKLGITACAGSLIYFKKGLIVQDLTLMLILGIMAGAYLGMNMLVRIKSFYVELFFGLLLAFVMVKMFLSI